MAPQQRSKKKGSESEAPRERVRRLTTLFTWGALFLPYFVISLVASDAIRESKTALQAALAGAGLLFLVFLPGGPRFTIAKGLAIWGGALGVLIALSYLKALTTWGDPYSAVPILGGLALFLTGASSEGSRLFRRLAPWIGLAGALTGLLAVLQRGFGVLRLPISAPEPRFHAAALLGNAGDTGMALVIPILLLFFRALSAGRQRWLSALGLALSGAGLVMTESVTGLIAVGFAVWLYLILSPGRRVAGMVLLGVGIAGLFFTGMGSRIVEKTRQLARGEFESVFTQRDIGVLSAIEMMRGSPILGVGPGAYSNRFVPARIAAEERSRRHLVHKSDSAHFENAHSEPFNIATETGIPAALLATGLLGFILFRLPRTPDGREDEGPANTQLLVLVAAFAVVSLTNFPLRIAVTSGLFAFLSGLAVSRVSREQTVTDNPKPGKGVRIALACLSGILIFMSFLRGFAFQKASEGEAIFRMALNLEPELKPRAFEAALERVNQALAVSPRRAATWLSQGSIKKMLGDNEGAWIAYRRSLAIEERAETVLNLARVAEARGDIRLSWLLKVRAIWVLPHLLDFVPAGDEWDKLHFAVKGHEEALRQGTDKPPQLPELTQR